MKRPPPGSKKYIKQGAPSTIGDARMTISGFSTNADGQLVATLQQIGSESTQDVTAGNEVELGGIAFTVTKIDRPEGEKGVVWLEKVSE